MPTENQLEYRVIIEPEHAEDGSTVFTAYCPTLGIADYGDSIEQVQASIEDGIALAVETLLREGKEVPHDNIREQVLTKATVPLPL